jgi:uncharacterized protein YbbK (DUF523 family)
MDESVLVSACLLGVVCRFDCESKAHPAVLLLARTRHLVPVCPEQLGGLPTPRPRHEQREGRIVSEHGRDATEEFERGAQQALTIAKVTRCRRAILKARSPSCGVGTIYDGTFSGKLVAGDGILAGKLREEGIAVCSEDDLV